jgi:hypothetical protein
VERENAMVRGFRLTRLVAILAALLLVGATARAGESGKFSGNLLIRVPAKSVKEMPRAEFSVGDWRVRRMFDTTSGCVEEGSADAAKVLSYSWLVAEPPASAKADLPAGGEAWDIAHDAVDGTGPAPYKTLLGELTKRLGKGAVPFIVEPDIIYSDRRVAKSMRRKGGSVCDFTCRSEPECDELELCSEPSVHWPSGEFAWHLRSDKSQLLDARREIDRMLGENLSRVFVVHVDTGYSRGDILLPAHFDKDSCLDFTRGELPVPGGEDPCNPNGLNQPGHGTGTLSILAGNVGTVLGEDGTIVFDDFLGGAPRARVASYRVSDSVIHFYPSKLASAIAEAAKNGADVVSISMGGCPSWALRDAVNEAYCKGTAVFAAAGNSIHLPVRGASSPTTTVYPARFSRVVAVTGVTADDRTYAKGPRFWSLLRGNWGSWSMRGNYGPDSVMKESIAAYTPNISWSRIGDQNPSCLADLDGAGTSAATPQVAAAAALWLEKYRNKFDERGWRSWSKVEAVYRALFESAKKNVPDPRYSRTYFGQGILQAFAALDRGVPDCLSPRSPAEIDFGWLYKLRVPCPPLEIAPYDDAVFVARQRAHYRMMQVEMAQLLCGSRHLEEILGDARPEDLPDRSEKLRRFLKALREDERASKYLRDVLILNKY